MNDKYEKLVENLNNDNVNIRLDSLRKLKEMVDGGEIERPAATDDVNNHIHTTYSFSPYSPTKALWMAYNAGLKTAGIMDHDSISGALEFIEAGKIIGMATTIGAECRVDFSKTPLNGRRINNPDQNSIVYMAIHGIPHTQIESVRDFFRPYVNERNKRNRLMAERINGILKPFELSLDFDKDVVPLSKAAEGGSITERHILYGLAFKLAGIFGKGQELAEFLRNGLKLNIGAKIESYLTDAANKYYEYDLLGLLKGEMVSMFYIDASAECPDVKEVIELCRKTGAVSAYAYLGDVGDSVTGDKRTQKFEDDYIELLFDVIKALGFNAVTYMPSRNSIEQLRRVKSLCDKHGLFQISGEDINSPRQSFVCSALRNEEFKNLIDSTWALIGHEKAATGILAEGMFSEETVNKYPDLDERIAIYKVKGHTL